MKTVYGVEFQPGSREEVLPGFSTDFPYIASCAILNQYSDKIAPWHWHKEVELFYMESGTLEYTTPQGKVIFPQGSCGFVNSNVLHMTKPLNSSVETIQFLHLFDSSFIGGPKGSRIEHKYILPLLLASHAEVIALFSNKAEDGELLDAIKCSFLLSGTEDGYELKLRAALSEIWRLLLERANAQPQQESARDKANDKLKLMMIYVHEHYAEKVTIQDIAAAAFVSNRECFRIFRNLLRMTPIEYLNSYRLQEACNMLVTGSDSLTAISQACRLGSSSYFGKVFKEYMGNTPLEYRRKWQDSDMERHD